jgi:hypothetical protein
MFKKSGCNWVKVLLNIQTGYHPSSIIYQVPNFSQFIIIIINIQNFPNNYYTSQSKEIHSNLLGRTGICQKIVSCHQYNPVIYQQKYL